MFAVCKWPPGAPDGHLERVTIPDAVLIQFDLLIMSTTYFIFIVPCIVIFYGITNRCDNVQ
jgi:hypothetical protein